jgi:flavin-dependent dehydrogenase
VCHTRVDDVIRDAGGRVIGVTATGPAKQAFTADLVIGADGLRSTIAARIGAGVTKRQHATASLYSYWEGAAVTGYEWHYQPGASVGFIPTNAGATCVFVSIPSSSFAQELRGDATSTYLGLIARAPADVRARLEHARRVEPVRGFAGHPGYIRQGSGPGWALIGDAGYFKDPLTAHGITDALRDAELAARAVLHGTDAALEEYVTTRDDLSHRLFEITDSIASFAWTDPELENLHRSLSKEMSREVQALAQLPALTPASAPGAMAAIAVA